MYMKEHDPRRQCWPNAKDPGWRPAFPQGENVNLEDYIDRVWNPALKTLNNMRNTMSENTVTNSCEAQVEIGSRAWLIQFQEETFKRMMDMTRRKNSDYAGKGGDAFNNFTRVEGLCPVITTEMGFYVRLTDKFSRISSFIQNGELLVKDESAEDTLLDLSNYAFLMYAFLTAKKAKAKANQASNEYQVKLHQDALKYRERQLDKVVGPVDDGEKVSHNHHTNKSILSRLKDFDFSKKFSDLPEPTEKENIKLEVPLGKSYFDSLEIRMKELQEEVVRLHKVNQNLAYNNQVINNENKRLAEKVVQWSQLGEVSEIKAALKKSLDMIETVNILRGDKLLYEIGRKNSVVERLIHPDHKSFISGSTSEGGCTEDYSDPKQNN